MSHISIVAAVADAEDLGEDSTAPSQTAMQLLETTSKPLEVPVPQSTVQIPVPESTTASQHIPPSATGSQQVLAPPEGVTISENPIIKPSVAFSEPSTVTSTGDLIDENLILEDENLWRHDHTFDKLQEIYLRTIGGMEFSANQGVNLEPVKILFKNIWEGLETSHENLIRLSRKDHEMSADLATKMAHCKTLMKMAEDDPVMSQAMKIKLENAWRLTDTGETEEKNTILKINTLKDELFMLNRSIAAAAKLEGQDTIKELSKIKVKFENDKAIISAEAFKIHTAFELIKLKRQQCADLKIELQDRLQMLDREEIIQKEAIKRETNRKEHLELTIEKTMANIAYKVHDLDDMGKNLQDAEKRLAEADKSVRDQRMVNEDAQRDMENSNTRYEKMKIDYDNQAKLCERLTLDLFKRQADLKDKEDEVIQIKYDIARANRQLQINNKKVIEFQHEFDKLEKERDILRGKLAIMEKELEIIQKKMIENKRKVEELDKERSLINRNLQRAAAVTSEHISTTKTHEVAVRNLQLELLAYEKEIGEQKDTIIRLERERDNYSNEATKLAHTVAVRLDEIKLLDMSIFEYRKRLGVLELQLKKQQQLYDTGVYDKSILQRTLRDTSTEINANTEKLRHLNHTLISLKFQVHEKDIMVQNEALAFERIQKDTNFFSSEATRIKLLAHDIECQVEALEAERSTLGRTIAEAEGEISKQNYYQIAAESRKKVYHRKLMNKDIELRDIWGKWRTLHSTIRIGGYQFRIIMTQIHELRYHIFLVKKENVIIKGNAQNVRKLRYEISVLENVISKETCMCNGLREQMKHPINVHRWRILECTNPNAFEKVQKINLLTKRLVERNCSLASQSTELVTKQHIYVEIREALKKSPGLESPEDVRYYQHLLAAKNQQYIALKDDFKGAEAQTEYFVEEIQQLKDRLVELKSSYFKKLRKLIKYGPISKQQNLSEQEQHSNTSIYISSQENVEEKNDILEEEQNVIPEEEEENDIPEEEEEEMLENWKNILNDDKNVNNIIYTQEEEWGEA